MKVSKLDPKRYVNSNSNANNSKKPLQIAVAFAKFIGTGTILTFISHEYFSRFSPLRVYERRRFETSISLAINFHGFIDWNFWFGREQPSVFLHVVINFCQDIMLRLLLLSAWPVFRDKTFFFDRFIWPSNLWHSFFFIILQKYILLGL